MRFHGLNAPAIVLTVLLLGVAALSLWLLPGNVAILIAGLLILAAVLAPLSLLMANQWERAIVLRMGRLHSVRGPGMFFVVPFFDSVIAWLDQRIQTTQFNAE